MWLRRTDDSSVGRLVCYEGPMALSTDGDILLDPGAVTGACDVVRRYLTEALFGGDERALGETVADPELAERAWLFWAAFPERSIDEIDMLFADAAGSRVACHFTGTMVQEGPWINSTPQGVGGTVIIGCTAIYVVTSGRITNHRETWR
jgi:hypothetical protein